MILDGLSGVYRPVSLGEIGLIAEDAEKNKGIMNFAARRALRFDF
jgi:hypothetical protein